MHFSQKFLLALALLCASVTARLSYPSQLSFERELQEATCGHKCDCFKCKGVTKNTDGSLTVNVGHCKVGGSISWMCCVGVDGKQGNCPVTSCKPEPSTFKCNTIPYATGFGITIPGASKSFTINTHDGQTAGTAIANNAMCGGNGDQGGKCAGGQTAHCLITYDLAHDCGYGDTSTPRLSSGSGDPHFKTWTGHKFDYHGECDLVLVDNPSFDNGKGLRVHIRTKRIKYYSFIETIAVQIGDDILEFNNDVENFRINGAPVPPDRRGHKTMLDSYVIRRDPTALSIRLSGVKDRTILTKIDLHTRKTGFPGIVIDGGKTSIFEGSLGLLGDWSTGRMMARDGLTEMTNVTDYALEWQVRDTEPMLFHHNRAPQFPAQCTPPQEFPTDSMMSDQKRMEAEEACSHWKQDQDDCVFDVLATGDVFIAAEGFYGGRMQAAVKK